MIGQAIELGIKGIDRFVVNRQNYIKQDAAEAQERVDKLQEEQANRNELYQNKDLLKEYQSLASRVDTSGNNISLTSAEFERYNELSNQIASTFPTLISGYTATGDAILKCKNNAAEFNEALNESMQNSYVQNVVDQQKEFDDIWAGYREDMYAKSGFFSDSGLVTKRDSLKNFLNAKRINFTDKSGEFSDNVKELSSTLDEMGIEWDEFIDAVGVYGEKMNTKEGQQMMQRIQNGMESYSAQIEQQNNKIKSNIKAFYADTLDITDSEAVAQKDIIDSIVDNFDMSSMSGLSSDEIITQFKQLYSGIANDGNIGKSMMVDLNKSKVALEDGTTSLQSYLNEYRVLKREINLLEKQGLIPEGTLDSVDKIFNTYSESGAKYTQIYS